MLSTISSRLILLVTTVLIMILLSGLIFQILGIKLKPVINLLTVFLKLRCLFNVDPGRL